MSHKFRLALLSNVTVDLLAEKLKKDYDVYIPAGFDTWQQEVVATSSGLYEYKPEAVVLLLHVSNALDVTNDLLDEWRNSYEILCKRLTGIPVFISSIDINTKCIYGAEKRLANYFENYFIQRIQDLHENAGLNIYVLPVKDCITNLGRDSFYSPKMWYFGSMPYSMKGLSALEALISKYIRAVEKPRKKCLSIDLDNTLWGGIIGEDGVEGIVLSSQKQGAVYKDTQRILKQMKDQGVMLTILSKNNLEDVEPVFNHPDMMLHHNDFVAEIIDWEPKTNNIRKLAAQLNIGLDSFVFLDDSPMEREQMKAECPEVTVIDFPRDTSLLPDVIARAYDDFFFSLEITAEDKQKTEMYRAENQRKVEMTRATSLDEFLKKLEMKLDIHKMLSSEEKRVIQLLGKTNQFNVTTNRYNEDDVNNLLKVGADVITVHVVDKYGDQGLVAVLILTYHAYDSTNKYAYIDTFLMSCRVMGRNIEFEVMATIKDYLQRKGISTVKASYVKTTKNSPVSNLFEKLGFKLLYSTDSEKAYEANVNKLPISALDNNIFKEVSIAL